MSNSIQTTFWKKANENFNFRYASDVEQLDVQPFMAHDIFTLNIFDEEVKKYISSKSTKKLSREQLNKLSILLKYFLRTGISKYHFANNDFTKKFVYSDNSTINKYLDILQDVELITYSKFRNEKNPKLQGYSINPTKALNFAISLKENNRFTRGKKKEEEIHENIVSYLDNDYNRNEDNFYCNEEEDEKILSNFIANNPLQELYLLREEIDEKAKELLLFKSKVEKESIPEDTAKEMLSTIEEEFKKLARRYRELNGCETDLTVYAMHKMKTLL